MVLGTSDVRLIDMTRAFASVANQGVAVTPYAIRKVVTADGRLLYQHEGGEERVLVAPWVAAEMTDLLQSAVLTGTGRAAQIGRPVAGKTGTTSSNKDGWFIGFSSGLTTGVWMGRDDARPVGGLQGGTAPARAFHDFMAVAVASRPVEQFETAGADARLAADAGRRDVRRPDARCERRCSRWSTRTACRSARRRTIPAFRSSQPMVRPDGTGDPSQQRARPGLPAAAAQPPPSAAAAAAAAATRASAPPPDPLRSRGPIRRRSALRRAPGPGRTASLRAP